jgi:hypothetical protein
MDLVNVKLALDDIYLMLNSVNDYVDKVIVSKNFNGVNFENIFIIFLKSLVKKVWTQT